MPTAHRKPKICDAPRHRCYVIRGSLCSSNYIEIPNTGAEDPRDRAPLNAKGAFLYVQFRAIPKLETAPLLMHLDLGTTKGSMRVSFSNLYSAPKMAGQTLRVPLRFNPDGRWSVLAVDIPSLLKVHAPASLGSYRQLRGVKLCSSMMVRSVWTSHSAFAPASLPADMRLPSPPASWHEVYSWSWCPHAPQASALAAAPDSAHRLVDVPKTNHQRLEPSAVDDMDGANKEDPNESAAAAAVLSVSRHMPPPPPSPVRLSRAILGPSQSRPPRPAGPTVKPCHAFPLERVIGCSAQVGGSVAFKRSALLFPVEHMLIVAEPDGSQRFLGAGHHTSDVTLVCASHEGKLLCSAQRSCGDGAKACLWSLSEDGGGQWLCDLGGHSSSIDALAFSTCDQFLVTVGRDTLKRVSIVVWEVALLRSGALGGGAFGAFGASGSSRGAGSGSNLAIIARQISDFDIAAICFHPTDHTRLVSCGRENIRFWRVSRRHLPGSPAEAPANEGYGRGLSFSALCFEASAFHAPEDPSLARGHGPVRVVFVASSNGTLCQVDSSTRRVLAFLKLHSAPVTTVLATEGYVATGAADGLLRLWPLDFSEFLMQAQHDSAIASVAVSDDELKLAVSTTSGTLGLLDVATHEYATIVRAHRSGIAACALAPAPARVLGAAGVSEAGEWGTHGGLLATAGCDKTIRVFDLSSGQQNYEFNSTEDRPTTLAFHPTSGGILACGFSSGSLRILSVASTATLHEYQQQRSPIREVVFSPSGALLFAAAVDGTVCVHDSHSAYQPLALSGPTGWGVNVNGGSLFLAASTDGAFLAVAVSKAPSTKEGQECGGAVVLDPRSLKVKLGRLRATNFSLF